MSVLKTKPRGRVEVVLDENEDTSVRDEVFQVSEVVEPQPMLPLPAVLHSAEAACLRCGINLPASTRHSGRTTFQCKFVKVLVFLKKKQLQHNL